MGLGPAAHPYRRLPQAAARSAVVTMTAMPPLETRQQSSKWNGSAIHREEW